MTENAVEAVKDDPHRLQTVPCVARVSESAARCSDQFLEKVPKILDQLGGRAACGIDALKVV